MSSLWVARFPASMSRTSERKVYAYLVHGTALNFMEKPSSWYRTLVSASGFQTLELAVLHFGEFHSQESLKQESPDQENLLRRMLQVEFVLSEEDVPAKVCVTPYEETSE